MRDTDKGLLTILAIIVICSVAIGAYSYKAMSKGDLPARKDSNSDPIRTEREKAKYPYAIVESGFGLVIISNVSMDLPTTAVRFTTVVRVRDGVARYTNSENCPECFMDGAK